jgi:hypothetical protein
MINSRNLVKNINIFFYIGTLKINKLNVQAKYIIFNLLNFLFGFFYYNM